MAISKDEIRTIAITTAVAAAATAIATSIVGFLMERYLRDDTPPGPMFVVVPVVERPVPPLPPLAGYGRWQR